MPRLRCWRYCLAAILCMVTILGISQARDRPPRIRVVSRVERWLERFWSCEGGAVSGGGRFVAYQSIGYGPPELPSVRQVVVKGRRRRPATLVSANSDGVEANQFVELLGISADGRMIAFYSPADNLVPNDNNGTGDVFVRHLDLGETIRVSVSNDGVEANDYSSAYDGTCISGDGRYVVFESGATNLAPGTTGEHLQIYCKDLQTGVVTLVSVTEVGAGANHDSYSPSISGNGRYIAYSSYASDLVEGDTNGTDDIFVFDRETLVTRRASIATDGTEANDASWQGVVSNGGRVAFGSSADNLVPTDGNQAGDVFLHDLDTGETVRVSEFPEERDGATGSSRPSISGDGRRVVFQSDMETYNGDTQVYCRDLVAGTTRLVSVDRWGSLGDSDSLTTAGSLSADGEWCVFYSTSSNLARHYQRDGAVPDVFIVRLGPTTE